MRFGDILERLRDNGLKLTPQRVAIVRTLLESKAPMSAQEVLKKVRTEHPSVSLDTVYRNLSLLTEVGLANQVNLQNREISRFEFQGDAHHHHHVVCLKCSRAFCVDICPSKIVQPPSEDPEFKVVGHAFEVYGYCSRCQAEGRVQA